MNTLERCPKVYCKTSHQYSNAFGKTDCPPVEPFEMGAEAKIFSFYVVGAVAAGAMNGRWNNETIQIELVGIDFGSLAQ